VVLVSTVGGAGEPGRWCWSPEKVVLVS